MSVEVPGSVAIAAVAAAPASADGGAEASPPDAVAVGEEDAEGVGTGVSRPVDAMPTDDCTTGAPSTLPSPDCGEPHPPGTVPTDDCTTGGDLPTCFALGGAGASGFGVGATSSYLFVRTGTCRTTLCATCFFVCMTCFAAGMIDVALAADAAAGIDELRGVGNGANACSFGTLSSGKRASGTMSVGSGALYTGSRNTAAIGPMYTTASVAMPIPANQ